MSMPDVPLCSNCGYIWSAASGDTLTSPFPTLVQSNETPSSHQAREIRNMVLDAERDLARLDIEITRLQDTLDNLSRTRDVLRGHIQGNKAVISPIRGVPSEIWSEIFLNCDPHSYPMTNEAPLSLTGVSRQWREIAISTPLWSNIYVDNEGESIESQANWVKLWLSRSKARPLTFSFCCKSLKIPNPAFDALAMHSSQWHNATFTIPSEFFPSFATVAGRVQQLQKLHLVIPFSLLRRLEIVDAFKIAPSLREVNLGHWLPWNTLSLPWAQLTHLVICPTSIGNAIQILGLSPNLEDCELTQRGGFKAPTAPLQHIQHTCLRRLHVDFDLFEHVTLPNLRQLSVGHMQWPILAFSSFLSRSSCTIETLFLYWIRDGPHLVIQSLYQMPSISTLHIDESVTRVMITDELLTHLTYRPEQSPCMLPNLRELRFASYKLLAEEKLVEMIQSRRRKMDTEVDGVVARLQVVTLTVDTPIGSKAWESLELLRRDGLIFTLTEGLSASP